MTKNRKIGIIALAVLLIVVLIISILLMLMFIRIRPERYTEAQHLQRVTERAERYFFGEKSNYKDEYSDMAIYPLYNADEQLEFFLIEFEPGGYAYVQIDSFGETVMWKTMYHVYNGSVWSRYRVWDGDAPYPDDGWKKKYEDEDKVYEADINGEIIEYNDSHFKVANIDGERRYLLEIERAYGTAYIPAVKRGDKYLNLVSMEEFDLGEIDRNVSISEASISFIIKINL